MLGFDQAQAGGCLGKIWKLPEALIEAMTHCLETDYHGSQKALVSIVGLAVKMVSASFKKSPCPESDIRLLCSGITEKDFNEVYQQLNRQVSKTQAMAKILI
ncbi:MAG: HD-like signal output (HDOD) protein [Gammaproteobacteria bacterium]